MTLSAFRRVKHPKLGAWDAGTLLAGASLAGVLSFTTAAAAGEPCVTSAAMRPPPEFAALQFDFARFFRSDPDRVLTVACAEADVASSAGERARSQVDLGAALVGASREREAIEILGRAIVSYEADTSIDRLVVAAL